MDEQTREAAGIVFTGAVVMVVEAAMFIFFPRVRDMYIEGSYILMATYSIPILLFMIGMFKYLTVFSKNSEKEQLVYRIAGFILVFYWLIDAIRMNLKPTLLPFWAFVAGVACLVKSLRALRTSHSDTQI